MGGTGVGGADGAGVGSADGLEVGPEVGESSPTAFVGAAV